MNKFLLLILFLTCERHKQEIRVTNGDNTKIIDFIEGHRNHYNSNEVFCIYRNNEDYDMCPSRLINNLFCEAGGR